MRKLSAPRVLFIALLICGMAYSALVVPPEIEQPGTQPGQVTLESVNRCDNCHGGYDQSVEPDFNWRGGMMSQAGRDPIFWATMAIAEQDFDGAGDLCLRCHSPQGWIAGRSTPTDGSALRAADADGVECDLCHKMANPNNSEHIGVQTPPYVANDGGTPATGYYGSGMYSLYPGAAKLGPYAWSDARHQYLGSNFHRSSDFCGTCHDVSNPAVGDLAHNNGAQVPLAPGTFSGVPGSPVHTKAAFNNFPYMYGIVERTFSEHKASSLSQTLVSNYANLPEDLKAGAVKSAYQNSIVAGTGGNYEDGTPRYFSCQTCHVRPTTGAGCNKNNAPIRKDLPLHDMTGGNYWIPDAIQYLDTQGKLRLGGGLTTNQKAALNAGKSRAQFQLREAISLSVSGNTVKAVNLTGHKVISGYPEGRRMWLNIKWYGPDGSIIREDGRYGPMTVTLNGNPTQVNSILDLYDPNTKIYEAHYAMTQEWANQLLSLGYPANMPLSYDRITGEANYTLGQLAAQAPGTYHETFHFVLNNKVAKDNRIPPYGMSYDAARARNSLPVPATQYGNPGPGGVYNYWDEVMLNPPSGAVRATINMMYQPTSWEYVQFLYLANNKQNAFLANEGDYLLEAWLNTGMAEPYVMASTVWGPSIGALRGIADGAAVSLSGKVVTAVFPGAVYVEEADRSAGIRIHHNGVLSIGDVISVDGTMTTTTDGERAIVASSIAVTAQGQAVPKALGVIGRNLGGSGVGYYGLDNTGLLVQMAGKVTASGTGYFYLDDGSGVQDGTGPLGVRVAAFGLTAPQVGQYVKVKGISACYKTNGIRHRLIRACMQSDIVVVN